ncbi:MAG: hypothetical protein P4L84_24570 [Isosphaeraceae bacterium]|nr:hypothetical protein [Isosphaeraceae bacterium]
MLITTSIIVHVPDGNDADDAFSFVEPFEKRMRSIVEDAFRGESFVEYPSVINTTAIYFPDTNAGKCERCGRWVSDNRLPGEFDGLSVGRLNDGRWICTECLYWADQRECSASPDDAFDEPGDVKPSE